MDRGTIMVILLVLCVVLSILTLGAVSMHELGSEDQINFIAAQNQELMEQNRELRGEISDLRDLISGDSESMGMDEGMDTEMDAEAMPTEATDTGTMEPDTNTGNTGPPSP